MSATQSKERRSGSRQFHKKSRNSCLPCRRRRVKCNLQPPTCANCNRRNERCSYTQESRESHTSNKILDAHGGSSEDNPISFNYSDFNSYFPILYSQDLCESRHLVPRLPTSPIAWVMERTFTLSWLSESEREDISLEFDRQANSFKYVQETIAALYALHEWSQIQPRSNLYAIAYKHHIEASISFRHSQAEVNTANWIATLLFGIGVIVFQFATALTTSDETDNYLQLLHVLRKSSYIATELAPYIRASPLMQFTVSQHTRHQSHLDEQTWNAVCCLDALDYPEDTTEEARLSCVQAIAALKRWVAAVKGYPKNWRQFIDWPAAVSEQYLSALSNKHPVALVIFIYWCSVMHRSPRRWYMVGWTNRAATVAMKHLGPEWDLVLEFPRNVLSNGLNTVDRLAFPAGNLYGM
ncbi:hypothetical protein M426DRAFT_78281 [Hypoxylon sp. CI-4A]|nr:hypothetical protein M426DRAFT_78281 [Hypoxylon sp. CI-4A]